MKWLLMTLNIFVVGADREVEERKEETYIVMNRRQLIRVIPRESVQEALDMTSLFNQESISLLNDM